MASPVVVKHKNGQFWVVNTSPPGSGPGGTSRTEYTIMEGTEGDTQTLPDAGGISGPYTSVSAAYQVWAHEPQNQNVSTLTQIEQALSAAEHDLTHTGEGPTGGFSSGSQGFGLPNPLSGLAAIAAALAKAVGYLSDISTWRSLGWIILGAVLFIAGVWLWLKQNDLIPKSTPVPVPLPV